MKGRIKKALLHFRKMYHQSVHGSCAVLLYHRVTKLQTDPQLLAVSPDNFDTQLHYLSVNHRVLTVEEFQWYLERGKKFPSRSVMLTFDDGYADNYLEALPILEKYKVQALFYVATGTLNTPEEYWWDAVERIVLLSDQRPAASAFELKGKRYSLEALDANARKSLYEKLLPEFRAMRSGDRELKTAELAKLLGADGPRQSHRPMRFDELRHMAQSPSAVIGAHTHLHPSLASLSVEDQLQEIVSSKEILEEILKKPVHHFSYPFGTVNDFNHSTLQIVKDLAFDMVAANYPYIVHGRSNKYAFPRFLVRDWKLDTFKTELNSFFS